MDMLTTRKKWLMAGVVVLVAGLIFGGMWMLAGDGARNRGTDAVGQSSETSELTHEEMERYFEDYAEATAEYDPENLLIVTSAKRPQDDMAVAIVTAPNHIYYMVYESGEARDAAYEKLAADDSVMVEKNAKMQLLDYNSWGIAAMGLDDTREAIGNDGEPVRVAVIDSGLDVDLFRQHFPDVGVETFDVETASHETAMVDEIGHGTHVAGTIAEGAPENTSILAIRAMRNGRTDLYVSDVTTAIDRARYDGADVINMSLGAYDWIESQRAAIETAKNSGIVTVAAAGNDARNDVMYPAGYDNTIAVSAINADYSFAYYSNYGEAVDFAAPGSRILSINGYADGTSMATPHVTASVAALKSLNTGLSLDDTRALLRRHVRDLGETGRDEQYGYGMVDLNGAEFCTEGGHCDEYGVFAIHDELAIDNLTSGLAETEVLADGVKVVAEKACTVIISQDNGQTYTRVPAVAVPDAENTHKFEFVINSDTEVMVALNGDVNMNGAVNARDSALIDYYIISNDNPAHHELSEVEKLVADINNSGTITARDAALVDYSILSNYNQNHKALEW